MLVVLLIGTGLRTTGILNDSRTGRLNTLTYYVALPALIFGSTYRESISELFSPGLVGGLVIVLVATAVIAWLVHRNLAASERQSVALVQSYHSNLGYLGLPLVAATFSNRVTAVASVILGVLSLVQVPLTIMILTAMNDAEVRLTTELKGLAKNPVLLSLLAGLAVGSADLAIPSIVTTGLSGLGSLALPLALVSVGASLQMNTSSLDLGATGSIVAIKNGCMPLLTWIVFSLLGVDPSTFTASVVMLGTPTAVSTFIYADELGGDSQFASINVFATTLVSMGTLFVLVGLVN